MVVSTFYFSSICARLRAGDSIPFIHVTILEFSLALTLLLFSCLLTSAVSLWVPQTYTVLSVHQHSMIQKKRHLASPYSMHRHISFHFALQILLPVYKMKVCGNSALRRDTGATFPTEFAHFGLLGGSVG